MNNLQSSLSLVVSPIARDYLESLREREVKIAKIKVLLGEQYRMDGISAALNAADLTPDAAYELLSANRSHPKLNLFYEALTGRCFCDKCGGRKL